MQLNFLLNYINLVSRAFSMFKKAAISKIIQKIQNWDKHCMLVDNSIVESFDHAYDQTVNNSL